MGSRTGSIAKELKNSPEANSILTSSNPVDIPEADEPASPNAKRKSTGDANESSSLISEAASPKRQRLAVRTREDESTRYGHKTHIEVEIPTSPRPKRPRTSPVPDSQDADGELDSEPDAEPSSASRQLEEEASQRLSQQPAEEPTPAPKAKGKHLVFGDDDDVDKFVAAAATGADNATKAGGGDAQPGNEEEGSDGDDDAAPEAVSTQAVAKQMQKAAQAAEEAAEKQAASLKRKRQEKDSLYKQQAQRRKRARGTVEVHQSKHTALPQERSSSSGAEDREVVEVETAVTTGRRRAQKVTLPAVLPAEFLTDSSSEDGNDGSDDEEAARKKQVVEKPTKIRFDALGEEEGARKKPRDRTVGSTRYRVLADRGDQRLAPRAQRNTRVSKESLLKRKRAGVAVNKARGFFVKR
ncbi:hypothetical protein GGR54DRAFT_616054 [Hypoxylon sp. NC1633]|nr:hypothetical protein GGR54DRAFT_616054 [Hypoxylon sp. NC1633]